MENRTEEEHRGYETKQNKLKVLTDRIRNIRTITSVCVLTQVIHRTIKIRGRKQHENEMRRTHTHTHEKSYMSRLHCILDRKDEMMLMIMRCNCFGMVDGNEQRRKGNGKDERNGGR